MVIILPPSKPRGCVVVNAKELWLMSGPGKIILLLLLLIVVVVMMMNESI